MRLLCGSEYLIHANFSRRQDQPANQRSHRSLTKRNWSSPSHHGLPFSSAPSPQEQASWLSESDPGRGKFRVIGACAAIVASLVSPPTHVFVAKQVEANVGRVGSGLVPLSSGHSSDQDKPKSEGKGRLAERSASFRCPACGSLFVSCNT